MEKSKRLKPSLQEESHVKRSNVSFLPLGDCDDCRFKDDCEFFDAHATKVCIVFEPDEDLIWEEPL